MILMGVKVFRTGYLEKECIPKLFPLKVLAFMGGRFF
jgi:hypothetical protein